LDLKAGRKINQDIQDNKDNKDNTGNKDFHGRSGQVHKGLLGLELDPEVDLEPDLDLDHKDPKDFSHPHHRHPHLYRSSRFHFMLLTQELFQGVYFALPMFGSIEVKASGFFRYLSDAPQQLDFDGTEGFGCILA
jgi:hypothetical protein